MGCDHKVELEENKAETYNPCITIDIESPRASLKLYQLGEGREINKEDAFTRIGGVLLCIKSWFLSIVAATLSVTFGRGWGRLLRELKGNPILGQFLFGLLYCMVVILLVYLILSFNKMMGLDAYTDLDIGYEF